MSWAEANHTQGLDAQALREFFRHLKTTGLSETTNHGHFPAIRVFLNFLVRRKIIEHSLLADADIKIRQRWKRPELPNAEKLHRLLTLMKADVFLRGVNAPDFLMLRDYAIVLSYLESGARRSEGLITLNQLDLQFGMAETNQKVRQETLTRSLFFHRVLPALRYYVEERTNYLKTRGCEDEKALWVGRNGQPFRADSVTHMFHIIRNRYGWEGKFHPHKLTRPRGGAVLLADKRS